MDKELELITQVTTVGDLRSKLIEAEEVKVEVEAILLERVSFPFFKFYKFLFYFFLFILKTTFLSTNRMLYYKKHVKNGINAKRS